MLGGIGENIHIWIQGLQPVPAQCLIVLDESVPVMN